jgi:hypothetical protein
MATVYKHNDELFNIYYVIFDELWIQDGAYGHNFERGPPKDHFSKVLLRLAQYGQNCSILSQQAPKFALYKHNDELFNIYNRIFYKL